MAETMTQNVIEFDRVSKIYRLGSASLSLRAALGKLFTPGKKRETGLNDDLYALNDVSFAIPRAESVGLIGPNGSGKTTSLKLISNITRCEAGRVAIQGRVSALIELGAGFHPDLTGRENVFFNAAILGMREEEIRRRFDAIVDFSGLERFLDTPVKRYSSGMYCRLGFAVAAFVNPDVLLVDEVLAVGDTNFQNKCLRRMNELREQGTTIFFVTHNLGYLQRLCTRAIFLYKGKIVQDGAVNDVIQAYRDHASYNNSGGTPAQEPVIGDGEGQEAPGAEILARITGVYFSDGRGQKVDQVRTGEDVTLHLAYEAARPLENVNFEVWLYGMDGVEYASFASDWDQATPRRLAGAGEMSLRIPGLCLMPGAYFVNAALSTQNGLNKLDQHWERHRLIVLSGPVTHGIFYQPHAWSQPEAEKPE
jgi:lipopolysaccharide transport system ATP-binding protein